MLHMTAINTYRWRIGKIQSMRCRVFLDQRWDRRWQQNTRQQPPSEIRTWDDHACTLTTCCCDVCDIPVDLPRISSQSHSSIDIHNEKSADITMMQTWSWQSQQCYVHDNRHTRHSIHRNQENRHHNWGTYSEKQTTTQDEMRMINQSCSHSLFAWHVRIHVRVLRCSWSDVCSVHLHWQCILWTIHSIRWTTWFHHKSSTILYLYTRVLILISCCGIRPCSGVIKETCTNEIDGIRRT